MIATKIVAIEARLASTLAFPWMTDVYLGIMSEDARLSALTEDLTVQADSKFRAGRAIRLPAYGEVDVDVTVDDGVEELPSRQHEGDAGADLRSNVDVTLGPGEWKLVGTGVHVALPTGMLMWVVPRSGLAANHGVTVLNPPGLIDSGYRGELKVCLINHGREPFVIHRGDRIAQAVVQEYVPVKYEIAEFLDETDRGEGGFGSTGVE